MFKFFLLVFPDQHFNRLIMSKHSFLSLTVTVTEFNFFFYFPQPLIFRKWLFVLIAHRLEPIHDRLWNARVTFWRSISRVRRNILSHNKKKNQNTKYHKAYWLTASVMLVWWAFSATVYHSQVVYFSALTLQSEGEQCQFNIVLMATPWINCSNSSVLSPFGESSDAGQ